MLQNKSTIILSEIKDFFTTSEKAMNTIFDVLDSFHFSSSKFGLSTAVNLKYSNKLKLTLLLLFPLFEIKTPSHYQSSVLYRYICCGKDLFYRFINRTTVDWRSLVYSLNLQLLKKVGKSTTDSTNTLKCLIIDDTDLPKTGWRIELIGRIFSHVTQSSILGFKGLFMGYHDGKNFFALDFSIHGEKGKNKKKPYGLTPTQFKGRYNKKRDNKEVSKQRKDEYFSSKTASMLKLVRIAIAKGIRFNYLLVDSWFTSHELLKFILTRRIKCHLLGMIKMGITKYHYEGKDRKAPEIIDLLKKRKKTKYSKLLKAYYAVVDVDFQGIRVRLFFCKTSKKGKWKAMMSTNTELKFEEAYKIYATRWSIEVFFKEAKQYLGLGKCESRDFDAHVARTSVCILQYNLLAAVKRCNSYESLGALFRESKENSLEITISEKIWLIITTLIADLAELFDFDFEIAMEKIVNENQILAKYFKLESLLE